MSSGLDTGAYRIGEAARLAGVTARTIRYDEELGLIGARRRLKGAHRLYTDVEVARLIELVRLRDLLGLTLDELTALAENEQARTALRDQWAETASDAARRRILREAIALVEKQLETVSRRRERLDEFAGELSEKLASLSERLELLERATGPMRARGARAAVEG